MNKGGRPSKLTPKMASAICTEISTTTKSLKTICEMEGMPHVSTVLDWLANPKHKWFTDRYTRAKEEQADLMCEEMLDIADDGTNDYMTITKGDIDYNVENKEVTSRSKLRVETRKWLASKLKPKKYGDKVTNEVTGKDGGPVETQHVITFNLEP